MYRTQSRKVSKKVPVIILVSVLLVVGAFFAYRVYHSSHKKDIATPTSTTENKVKTDLSPATSEEKKDSAYHKEASATNPQTPTSSTTAKSSVTPVIVDASQYDQIEVRSYVPGIVENGGTCTIKFTKGSLGITKTVAANADATTTRCTNLDVNRSEFSQTGTWSVVVSYTSASAQGSSQTRTFEVK